MFGWHPTIGDPSTLGWATVFAYAVAAIACWFAADKAPRDERRWWQALAIVMALLAVNKQLDLQTLMTQIGRTIAHHQGWYERRRPYQKLFIEVMMVVGVVAGAAMLWRARRKRPALLVSIGGLALLGTFIVVRATSLEQVDNLINRHLGTPKINHLMELGGIAIVTVGALLALRERPRGKRR